MAKDNKNRSYVTVGIGKEFRDLAQRLVQLKNAVEGTKLSLRAYLERLIELDAAENKNNPKKMDLSSLDITFGLIEDNEPGKLPSLTATINDKPIGRVQVVATIDGQDALGNTYDELAEAIGQGRDVVIEWTKTAPDSE